MVDADVVFKSDPFLLFSEFAKFPRESVVGAANDLAPHYYQMLTG